jgi:hypothetical protein
MIVKLVGLNRGINNKSIQITYKFQVLAVGKKTSIHIQNSDLKFKGKNTVNPTVFIMCNGDLCHLQ